MNTCAIHEANIERLEKKLLTTGNKCKKYGCEFSYRRVGEEFREIKVDDVKHVYRYILVEAEGQAIISGWRFIASLEHTQEGNIIKAADKDIEVPEKYYNSDPICEHCNTSKNRKGTYVVRNEESGEFKQVGKSCLKDYTNGMDAEAIAAYISQFDELIKAEEILGGGFQGFYYDTDEILRYMAETIKHFGYVKSGYGNYGTSSRSTDYYAMNHGGGYFLGAKRAAELRGEMDSVGFNADSPKTVELAGNARKWISEQDDAGNYIHNLKVVSALDYVKPSNFNLLASLFPAYDREIEYQAVKAERERERAEEEAKAKKSVHVGQVGDKLVVTVRDLRCVTSFEGFHGTTYLYKIVGEDNNVYIWMTGNILEDDALELKGTVKKHSEFRGVAQTVLTRCKVLKTKEQKVG